MGSNALIERARDRAWLESALTTAVAGRGSLVLVTGEAGIGKTRFAEDVLGTTGVRFPAALENGGLSRRELEAMRLVASGRTNREIAAALVLSPRTVDMHVRHIFQKLGCRSRTQAAAKAGDLGLLG